MAVSLIDIGLRPVSYSRLDTFLNRHSRDSNNPFYPIPASSMVSSYYVERGGLNFRAPSVNTRQRRNIRNADVAIGYIWFQHALRTIPRHYCCLLIIDNRRNSVALLDVSPSTGMILAVEEFLESLGLPEETLRNFNIIDMPENINP